MTDEDPREGRIRLGRRRKEAVESLDAIEMAEEAMEQAEPTMGPPDPAVLLVEEQRRLIKAQVSNERMGFVLRVMTACVGLAFVIGLCGMVWTASQSKAVVVNPFDSPFALTHRGHSGQVIARGVSDAIITINREARYGEQSRAVALTWTRDTAVVVPTTGVSIGDIDKLLRTWFGQETNITGSVTVSTTGEVSLTIRADGVRAQTFTGPESDMPRLIREASEYIYGQFQPELFTWYLLQTQRYEDAEAFLPGAYAQNPESRGALARYWGIMLSSLGRSEEAAEKLRLSIRANPDNESAWDMLVGVLFDTEGEEAAYRVGRDMAARTAEDGEPMESESYLLLVRDWTRLVEIGASDIAETGGENALGGQEVTLADAEANRHDFVRARGYLRGGRVGSPEVVATGHMIDTYEALTDGETARALTAMQALDALWQADGDVAYAFYEAPCYLGLTMGLSGRQQEAEAAFGRADRLIACATFRADVLEAQGATAEADRQYGVAIRLAPSLPFAYQRRGLALLARGDHARAVTRFRDAHMRGPRWADPLKGWGDALAAQGLYAAAVEKYELAIPLAPEWRALHLAHAAALNRLGRRAEAQAALDKAAA